MLGCLRVFENRESRIPLSEKSSKSQTTCSLRHATCDQTRREGTKTSWHIRSVLIIPQRKAPAIECVIINVGTAAFAKKLEESLHSDAGPPSSLTIDLYRQVDSVLLISRESAASRYSELDSQGTRLWNLASKHKSARFANPELLCLRMFCRCLILSLLFTGTVRVFPYLLIDSAQRWIETSTSSKSICIVKSLSIRLDNPCR